MVFCVSGHLYLKDCQGFRHFDELKPENTWYYNKIGSDWYYWDKKGNFKTNPNLYLGDIIEKEKSNSLFEFGLHAFTHEALTLESEKIIDSIVSSGIKAAKKIGVSIKTFACPFEMSEDETEPGKVFRVLNKYGIRNLFYSGKDRGLVKKRFLAIKKPHKENNLNILWISKYFEGNFTKSKMDQIIKEIYDNRNKDAVYCLGTHDFTHKNSKNLERLIKFMKKYNFS